MIRKSYQNTTLLMVRINKLTLPSVNNMQSQNWSHNWSQIWKAEGNKHIMTGPKGNSEFCFPMTLNVPVAERKQNLLFLVGKVIKCFVVPAQLQNRKTCKKLFTWCLLAHKFAEVSRRMTLSSVNSKFKLLFP